MYYIFSLKLLTFLFFLKKLLTFWTTSCIIVHMKRENVIAIFKYLLSCPPCRSGMRLRSEPELGRLLSESRQKVRRSLDVLVEDGYLTRKHGSGTYVRKVYPVEDAPSEEEIMNYTGINSEQIFMLDQTRSNHIPEHKKHRLKIGIPGDSTLLSTVNDLIVNGAMNRLEELEYKAIKYSHINYKLTSGLKSIEDLAKEFSKIKCDGYIFECRWADIYKKAFELAFGKDLTPPVTYLWNGSLPVDHEPLVQIDTNEALSRAVRILHNMGFSRIGLICMDIYYHNSSEEVEVYDLSMQKAGLEYRSIIKCNETRGKKLKNQLSELWKNNRPDALYVADDHFLPLVMAWMQENKLRDGKDIKIITLWNKCGHTPSVSRLEFDPRQVGMLAVNNMVRSINMTDEGICSFSHQAKWVP